MSEPKYDEDWVNLGYLKRVISDTEEGINIDFANVSRHYGSQPIPPYYEGDTWIDGNIVYTCINTRLVGSYTAADWTTESGATQKAESKNKVFLTQPSNYSIGDMWILQSDNDHKSGKRGEILITTVGRATYNEGDWVNMIGYGNIASINEVLGNINEAIETLELSKDSGVLKIVYDDTVPTLNEKDLWYVTEDISPYTKGELYKYDGTSLVEITDIDIINTFAEANQSTLTNDGKIQIFYEDREDVSTMAIGDICNEDGVLYRYNGTNWVAIYETKLQETIQKLDTTIERTTLLETDYGVIRSEVSSTQSSLNNYYTKDESDSNIESATAELENIIQQNKTEAEQTDNAFNLRISSIETNGVDKVQTSMGYTFNDEGLNIDKEGAETASTIDNEAFKVKSKTNNENVFFAGYVSDQNSAYRGQTIVESTNLVVKNYLNIEGASRFQPYVNPVLGGHGTGAFDIG